jgi:ketosteroid isomerase-like protein
MRQFQRAVLLLLMFVSMRSVLHAAQRAGDDELLKVRESVWRAWFAGDLTLLRKLVPNDTVVISSGDKNWKDQAAVLREAAAFHASGGRLTRLEFPKTEVQHFGNVAIVWSQYVLETDSGGKRSTSSGRVTEVFVERDGGWVNPGWHTDGEK